MSEGYRVLTVEDQTSSVSQNTSLSNTVAATPKKWQKRSGSSHSYGKSEYCAICKVCYESPEDIETDSLWLNCSKECDCGCMQDVQTSTMKTLTKGRDSWMCELKIISFVKSKKNKMSSYKNLESNISKECRN